MSQLASAQQLHRTGRLAEAEAVCRRLLASDPDDTDATQLLGVICLQSARPDEAVDLLRATLRARPDWAEAYNNLGVALQARQQFVKAENAFRAAVRLKPGYSQAWLNLGNVLRHQDRLGDAAQAYGSAAETNPSDAGAQTGLGSVCLELGRLKDGIAHFRRAADLRPDSPAALSDLLFWLLHDPDLSPQALFEEHRRWAEKFERPLRERGREAFARSRQAGRPLRVGYVSPDFREHTVARFFETILSGHDRRRVTTFCYSDVTRPDAFTARIHRSTDEWRDTATLSHDALASLVRDDGIDVLVDLTGHMGGNRLCVFARRAAPVQASYMAYPHSTGLESIDWRITDESCDPTGNTEQYHTERLLRLPGCAFCYAPFEEPPIAPLPARMSGYVTFGMLNRMAKVTPAAVALWSRVLEAVPGSRLVVLAVGGENNHPVRELFERNGITGERLRLVPVVPREQYLALAREVDIALDPFPYAGMTTTCDFLWMGVPTVTLAGDRTASRAGASILHAVNLPQLIAGNPQEYVAVAVSLATDLHALCDVRSSLRQRMMDSRLTSGASVARQLEEGYERMWTP